VVLLLVVLLLLLLLLLPCICGLLEALADATAAAAALATAAATPTVACTFLLLCFLIFIFGTVAARKSSETSKNPVGPRGRTLMILGCRSTILIGVTVLTAFVLGETVTAGVTAASEGETARLVVTAGVAEYATLTLAAVDGENGRPLALGLCAVLLLLTLLATATCAG